MPTLLPLDTDNNPIPALRLESSGAHSISASGTASRNTTAFDAGTRIVSVYADTPVYLAIVASMPVRVTIISRQVYIMILPLAVTVQGRQRVFLF